MIGEDALMLGILSVPLSASVIEQLYECVDGDADYWRSSLTHHCIGTIIASAMQAWLFVRLFVP